MWLIWGFNWSTALTQTTDRCENSEIPFCLSIAGNAQSVQVNCSRPRPEFIAESVPGCVNEFKVALCEIRSELSESCGSGDRQTKITAKLSKQAPTLSTSTPHLCVSLDSLRLQLRFWEPPLYSSSTAPPRALNNYYKQNLHVLATNDLSGWFI